MNVLVVEDDLTSLQIIETILHNQGHEVTGCLNAEVAWQFYQENHYPLVFSDWLLPKMDGLELCRKIRKHPKGVHSLVVIITVRQGTDYLKQILDAGADDYLAKPLDIALFNVRLTIIERQVKNLLIRNQSEKNLVEILSELEQSRNDMLAILNRLRTGTAMTDEDGRICFISAIAQQLCGKTEKELLGQSWKELFSFSKVDIPTMEAIFNTAPERRVKISIQTNLPNSQTSWLDIEIQDYPQEKRRKIFVLYDMSEIQNLKQIMNDQPVFHNMVGKSRQMRSVYAQIEEIANLDSTVLIEGETGTGKELAARAIHNSSNRSKKPFIAINCAGLAESVLASQLFGHKRGSFTGAVTDQIGFFEAASGGTLFLDEIGDISPNVQTTLLRVLEEKEITRLGETKSRKIDTRIITATNQDLNKKVANNSFRADLLYRIRVMRVQLPPLRDRLGDITLLIETFLDSSRRATGKNISEISKDAMRKLLEYSWPGNVREMKNAIQYSILKAKDHTIHISDLPEEISGLSYTTQTLSVEVEKEQLLSAIEAAKGNRTLAARLLGLSRATFYRRLKELNLPVE